MNSLDIIPPDFKLTGKLLLKDRNDAVTTISITKQRRLIPYDYQIDKNSELTPHMQLNVDFIDQAFFKELISNVPPNQQELFIAALGRKDYMDEILLCIGMNTPDLPNLFLYRIELLYIRLVAIINKVMELTTGLKGSRKPIYQFYFYSMDPNPQKSDAILRTLVGMQLTTLTTDKSKIQTVREELISLVQSEDIPVLDLLDLTLDQFNMILKLLPKESQWLTLRKQRAAFFDKIQSELTTFSDLIDKFQEYEQTWNPLYKRLVTSSRVKNVHELDISELQTLNKLQFKDRDYKQKIERYLSQLNTFIITYNSNGTLKYKKDTLKQSTSLINDVLNSQFVAFLQTFRHAHKKVLIESINLNENLINLD